MNNIDNVISEIMKSRQLYDEMPKPIKKIKMKEEFYNKLATEVQEQVKTVEVLDINKQPLNRLCDIRIEIDNNIKEDYEVIK